MNDKHVLFYVVPIILDVSYEKRDIGYLVVIEPIKTLSQILESKLKLPFGHIAIIDDDGVLYNGSPVSDYLLLQTRDSLVQFKELTVNDDSYSYIRHPFIDDAFFAIIQLSTEYRREINTIKSSASIFIVLLSLSFLALLYWVLNKTVCKPLMEINSLSEKIAVGDTPVVVSELNGVVHVLSNLTIRDEANSKRIEELLNYDELTGLHNRIGFQVGLDSLVGQANFFKKDICLIVIDIIKFSEINDLFGYEVGDSILKSFSQQIIIVCQEIADLKKINNEQVDFLIGRTGGDEFAIAVSFLKGKDEEWITKKIYDFLYRAISIDGYHFKLNINVASALCPTHTDSSKGLFQYTKMTLDNIKKIHSSSFKIFENSISNEFNEKKQLKTNIKMALMLDQFNLHYQPKVNLINGIINHFEALIRWNHPVSGMISPSYFIPFAEKEGLIIEIGEWVIQTVCKHIEILQNTGWKEFVISFNVSPHQIQDVLFVEKMKQIILHYSINPKHLEMEITENSFAIDFEQVINTVNSIRELGVRVAIDDFGRGYSSLSYLENLNINVIKLDREFINKANDSGAAMAIVSSVVAIAKEMNIECVAEGIESIEEAKMITEKKFNYGQGFFFYRPMPFKQIYQFSKFAE